MGTRLVGLFASIALLAASSASPIDPARAFLMAAFDVSPADIARLDCGEVFSRTLDVHNQREVATLGIVRIATSPSRYIERFRDIRTFKHTGDVLQVGTFSSPPQPGDLAALAIDDRDLKRLRECRVGNCDIRLPADAIESLRRDVDWRAAGASQQAAGVIRHVLLNYVAGYAPGRTMPTMEYADRTPRLNVGREFASLMDDDPMTLKYLPRLRRHLLGHPNSSPEQFTDFTYWSKELVRRRPVVSITHVAIAPAVDHSPIAYAVASKQIYAMHYYDASLGLTLLVPDGTAAEPATYVVYVNRSRIDLFEGVFGGMIRRIVAGRARGLVSEQLVRLQRVLADPR
jgi:hypothetical protein